MKEGNGNFESIKPWLKWTESTREFKVDKSNATRQVLCAGITGVCEKEFTVKITFTNSQSTGITPDDTVEFKLFAGKVPEQQIHPGATRFLVIDKETFNLDGTVTYESKMKNTTTNLFDVNIFSWITFTES